MITIETKHLENIEEFKSLKEWDFVACKFKRNVYINSKPVRFWVFEIYENKERAREIILERKHNIYFNYEMFLNGESHLEDILLIK